MIFQFFIGSTGTLTSALPSNFSGRCKCKLISINTTFSTSPASPLLLVLNGYPLFNDTPLSGKFYFISELPVYYGSNFEFNALVAQTATFTITDNATGNTPVNFSTCLITMDIEPEN